MRVLFAVSHAGFLRNFESGLRELVERGHEVHACLGKRADAESVTGSALQILDRLAAVGPGFSSSVQPRPLVNRSSALAASLRAAREYWRYLRPEYDDAPLLRARVINETPTFAAWAPLRLAWVRALADAMARWLERRLPIPEAAFDVLDEWRPDVMVVTPLIYAGSDQVWLVRAARARGIPVVYASGSWDHLTTKGLVHEAPDVTLVWNDAQIEEGVRLHGLRRDAMQATGAQAFDHWFGRQPTVDRATFCREAGLPPEPPLILYLCSSTFIAGDERAFIRDWLAALRSSSGLLARAAVLIRPHPQNADQWRDEACADGLTSIWPRGGANPIGQEARDDFFHSLYFSTAVVGLNTSAQIEAAIVGRPVFTVLSEHYARTQTGTLHFAHLRSAGGGLLREARSLDEHVTQLAQTIAPGAPPDERPRRFVEAFVRPAGLERSAASVFADAVERTTGGLSRRPAAWSVRAVSALLAPWMGAASAAANLRTTTAPARFQGWFTPAGPPFRHPLRPGVAPRVVCVAATPDQVERCRALTQVVADRGGRTLFCLVDGSPAGAAVKRLASELPRIISASVGSERQGDLLLRKFHPDVVLTLGGPDAGAGPAVLRAASRQKIPVIPVAGEAPEGLLATLPFLKVTDT
jgi:hypothetical protein